MKPNPQTASDVNLGQLFVIPLLNVILLLLTFVMLTAAFAVQPQIPVQLPKTITSDIIRDESLIISVTSEDVIYFNNRVVTIKELKKLFAAAAKNHKPILIKAERRAAIGRVVDIWDLGREMGIERINIATNKN